MTTRPPSATWIFATLVFLLFPGVTRDAAQDATNSPLRLSSVVAFVSTRDNPTASGIHNSELYVAEYQGHPTSTARLFNIRRLTDNQFGDGFPTLSPDGKKLVFDSNRLFPVPALNTSDLFVMDWDGENVAYLARGSSATWSPDGVRIAYHASASGGGRYIRSDPGSATIDSDIFVLNVDDAVQQTGAPTNLTNTPFSVDDDPDWSSDGTRIVFVRHDVSDNHMNSVTAEIWVMNDDGSDPTRLTDNQEEERGPVWSPDGARIAYACRRGAPASPLINMTPTFEICIMDARGGNVVQLTANNIGDLTPTWSPDGQRIVFHRIGGGALQLFEVNAGGGNSEVLTVPPGLNGFPNWGETLTRAAHPFVASLRQQ